MNNALSRRRFLALSGSAAVACTLPRPVFASSDTRLPGIAAQLYTIRHEIEKDIAGSLQKLAATGIQTVETAFWPKGVSVKQAAQYLKQAGLSVCSSHVEIPLDADHKAAALDVAEAFNCKKIIWHGWPEDKRYSSVDGTKELIAIYNEAGAWAKANGLQFGLHNHWWEYRNKPGGRFVYEWLLEGVSKDIFFEIDTYWVKVAGQDPAAIITKFGDRAKFLHMKDGPAKWTDALLSDHPDPMSALGKGAQNVPAIAKAAQPHIDWMVIEMDTLSTDPFAVIRDSYDYLVKNKFARG